MRSTLILLGLALLLSACGSGPAAATLEPNLRVGLSQAVGALRAALLACIPAESAEQISIETVWTGVVEIEEYSLLVQLGEVSPMPVFAAQVGTDRVVAVVNAANPLRQLSREQLADVFSGRSTNWANLGGSEAEIQVWIALAGDEARQLFRQRVLLGGEYRGDAHLAADAAVMLAALEADPAAIGLLPASLVPEALRGIETGIDAPILALAAEAPADALVATLACLQTRED